MTKQDILTDLDKINDLPTLPVAAFKFNQMVAEGTASMKEISIALGQDQAIVLKILKMANSAFFGLRKKVENLQHAVVILGINTVRNAVLSLSVVDCFKAGGKENTGDAMSLWKHSLAVAVTGQYLSQQTKVSTPDDCFVGGLLHDVGKLVLLQYFPQTMDSVRQAMAEKPASFLMAERELTNANHAVIGGALAKKWRLPEGLLGVIKNHHTMSSSSVDMDRLKVVHAANIIVNGYLGDYLGRKWPLSTHPSVEALMKKRLNTVDIWFPEIEPHIQEACSFFLEE
ncbi:MAG: HDOD domain-containing protein [Desulfatibacillum sp.]|nr:HDOD domain-containing protein [Desulfatibacillum sp.]